MQASKKRKNERTDGETELLWCWLDYFSSEVKGAGTYCGRYHRTFDKSYAKYAGWTGRLLKSLRGPSYLKINMAVLIKD